MFAAEASGLVQKSKLTEMEVQEVEQLVDICNRYENLYLHGFRESLIGRSGFEAGDFLYYQDGRLVGCLCLDDWQFEEKEIMVGVVHPDYRRRGIGQTLLTAAQRECISRGAQGLVLACEHTSSSGKAFIEAVGAQYKFSEHYMRLQELRESNTFDDRLYVRPAGIDDLDALVKVRAGSFEMPLEAAHQVVLLRLRQPYWQYYLALFGEENLGCEEPVGLLRLSDMQQEIGIYGFGVLPDYRGRGYGRQILEEVIRTARAKSQKAISLDVDVSNEIALGLYRSCGFQIRATYDYYLISL